MLARIVTLAGFLLLAGCSANSPSTTAGAIGAAQTTATIAPATRPGGTPPASGTRSPTGTRRPGGTPGRVTPAVPPPAVAFRPAPWTPGERTTYLIQASETGQEAGQATYTIAREPQFDELVVDITIGSTQDRFQLGFEAETLQPLGEVRSIVTATGTIIIRAEYHDGGATIETVTPGGGQRALLNLPPVYYANDQFLVILRALPFAEGYRGALTVVPSQGDPPTLATVVTVTDQETVATPLGSLRAWRVEAHFGASTQPQVLWYGVEAPHYLVKYDAGTYIYLLQSRS